MFEFQEANNDKFIANIISVLEHLGGDSDKQNFEELTGALRAISKNINYYFGDETDMEKIDKQKIIFISHATTDKKYVKSFVELLENLGLNEDEIICSSVLPYCIPLNGKVYEWLIDKFQNYDLHVFFMLSHNYYESPACLNEMGAAWAMKQKWTGILLPQFDFADIRGCIDSTQISIKLDDMDKETLFLDWKS